MCDNGRAIETLANGCYVCENHKRIVQAVCDGFSVNIGPRVFEAILVHAGVVDAAAIEDPPGYDGGKMLERVAEARRLLMSYLEGEAMKVVVLQRRVRQLEAEAGKLKGYARRLAAILDMDEHNEIMEAIGDDHRKS